MRIGEAAGTAGVHVQTLRYYERRGLLKRVLRRSSGYRDYNHEDIRVVRFIKRAQALGLSLDDATELLTLRRTSGPRERARRVAKARLDDLDRRIRDLKRMRSALAALVSSCDAGHDPHCPILEALETGPARARRHP
ncbi:MAG: MerR family transcriptional regulator [Acidobacteriota bacterium]